ncbi:MAG: ABC transporter permease [Vicinamibacterales bacterium]
MGTFLCRLWFCLRRSRHAADLRREIETHRSLRQDQLERDGASRGDAERASRRALGNVSLSREDVRGVWTPGWLERLWQDAVTGARIVRTAPGLTLTAVVLVALVIGGNATIYSMMHGVLRKGAPGVDASGLFTLSWINARGEPRAENSYERYLRLATETRTLDPLLACGYQRVAVSTDDGTYAVRAGLVSQNYFETLGVDLERGRAPSADESQPGALGLIAVISDRFWHEHFHGAEDVIGRSLVVNGQQATVIGVAPRWFQGAWLSELFDIWLPLASYPQIVHASGEGADGRVAPVIMTGRLRPGVGLRQAQAELATIDARLQWEGRNGSERVTLVPYSATAGGDNAVATQGGRFLAVFSVVTLLTLLIVCANVANLMLGRTVNRQREIAVRRALGCPHSRIVRMLVAEGIVVAMLAWVAAVAFAWITSGVLANVIPPPQGANAGFAEWYFKPDAGVAAYALVLAGIATVACVLGPVLFAGRQPLTPWLKSGDHSIVRGRSRLSRGLVVLQLALSVLLVAVAGLAWRSLSMVGAVDVGFSPDNILLVTVNTAGRAEDSATRTQLLETIRDRLQSTTGAAFVSYADSVPRESSWTRVAVRADAASEPTRVEINRVGPGFPAVYGLGITAGQDLSRTAKPGRRTALISQHLADTLWPRDSPIGKRLLFDGHETGQAEVVGIVPDAFYSGFRTDSRPYYALLSAIDDPSAAAEASFYVRADGDLNRVAAGVRDVLGPAGLAMPIVAVRTLESQLAVITAVPRLLASMLAAFGLAALLIATLGQYSVVLFETRRRVREFAVRLALGASPQRIQSSVIREGAWLSVIGLSVGGVLSLIVGQLMRGWLFGVSPTDATTYLAVAAVLLVTTIVACAIPARMASRVDPLRVLREE